MFCSFHDHQEIANSVSRHYTGVDCCAAFITRKIANAAYAVSSCYVGVDWEKRHHSKAFMIYHQEIVDAVSSGYVGVDWDRSCCSAAFTITSKVLMPCQVVMLG